MEIYHNPRCSKSRLTLELLKSNGNNPKIRKYFEDTPSKKELITILEMLGIKPLQLIRKSEAIFKENFKGKTFSDDEWINILVKYPRLIERPIVIHNGKAAIGRPPEMVLGILQKKLVILLFYFNLSASTIRDNTAVT